MRSQEPDDEILRRPAMGAELVTIDGDGTHLPSTEVVEILQEKVERARDYMAEEFAANTRRSYGSHLRAYQTWLAGHNALLKGGGFPEAEAFPVAPEILVLHLTEMADAGLSVSTINTRLAAIKAAHLKLELEFPARNKDVRAAIKGIRRRLGVAPAQKAAADAHIITEIVAQIPRDTITGKRDRALMLLGFAGAFRRSELVAVQVEHLTFNAQGLDVHVPRSKTDQEGEGMTKAILAGRMKVPEAVRTWIEAAGIADGLLFRRVWRDGRVDPRGLTGDYVAKLLKKYAGKAGYDVDDFAAHSLRAGFVTSAAEAGAALDLIMAVTGHKDEKMPLRYIRRADRYRKHAGVDFL